MATRRKVEHARAAGAMKRGGGLAKVPVEDALASLGEARGDDLLCLDAALTELAAVDERKSRMIELRYFGGLESLRGGLRGR